MVKTTIFYLFDHLCHLNVWYMIPCLEPFFIPSRFPRKNRISLRIKSTFILLLFIYFHLSIIYSLSTGIRGLLDITDGWVGRDLRSVGPYPSVESSDHVFFSGDDSLPYSDSTVSVPVISFLRFSIMVPLYCIIFLASES